MRKPARSLGALALFLSVGASTASGQEAPEPRGRAASTTVTATAMILPTLHVAPLALPHEPGVLPPDGPGDASVARRIASRWLDAGAGLAAPTGQFARSAPPMARSVEIVEDAAILAIRRVVAVLY